VIATLKLSLIFYSIFFFGFAETYVTIRGIGIIKGKPFNPLAYNGLMLPALSTMKSMSRDIDYGVGPKTAKIRDVIDEIAKWPGKILPKPNLIVI